MKYLPLLTLVLALAVGPAARAKLTDTYGDQLGTVQVPLTCNDTANGYVARGTALLHHMTYVGARAAFTAAAAADPKCALADWGQAMTYIHPLWSDPPSEADFNKGQALLAQAQAKANNRNPELAYISAAQAYYDQGWNRNEAENLEAFAAAWQAVHHQFPDDMEAASFYALAHLSTADPSDKTFAKQKASGTLAAQVLTRNPNHPGAHHYVIHAYDYPPPGGQCSYGGPQLWQHCPGRAPRPAHAHPHLHPSRALAGIHRNEFALRRSRPATPRRR